MRNNVLEMFNEMNKDNQIVCTQPELDDFMLAGLLFKSGDKYITRNMKEVKVTVNIPKQLRFNIDFSPIISVCQDLVKTNTRTNKVYCMSSETYDKYSSLGLIINIDNNDYYRFFDKELWLVYIFNKN